MSPQTTKRAKKITRAKPSHPVIHYAQSSQLALAISIIICTIISPHFLFSMNEGGISNYAVHGGTFIPITCGFTAAALSLFVVANKLDRRRAVNKHRIYLKLVGIGYLLVLLSTYPYQHGILLDKLHNYISSFFAILMLSAALFFARKNHYDRIDMSAVTLIALGFIVGVATLAGSIHLLFISQLLVGSGFGISLLHTAKTQLS